MQGYSCISLPGQQPQSALGCVLCRYGRDNLFRQMVDVQLVAAMGTPGGGRAFVTNRLLRHFNTLACAQVGCQSLPWQI